MFTSIVITNGSNDTKAISRRLVQLDSRAALRHAKMITLVSQELNCQGKKRKSNDINILTTCPILVDFMPAALGSNFCVIINFLMS